MLEVKNLSFGYKKKEPLFSHLSFSLPQGKVFTLLGPSGCGKSSLARLIMGFENPLGGEISIDQKKVFSYSKICKPPLERSASIVFQDFGLFPFMSVRENIEMWSRDDNTGDTIKDLLKALDITELLDKKAEILSGGQKQRVGLARALLARPKLLILDEPLSQLDEITKYRFLEYFKELRAQHSSMSCLWITHNPRVALQVSENLLYLEAGHLSGPVKADLEGLQELHPGLSNLTNL